MRSGVRLRRVMFEEARIVARDAGQARIRGTDGAPGRAERVDAPDGKTEHGGKQAAEHIEAQEWRRLRHRFQWVRDHHHAGRGRQDGHLRRGRAPDARQRAGPGKQQHGDGRRRHAVAGRQRRQAAGHGRQQAEAQHRDKAHAPRAGRVGQAGPESPDGGPGKIGLIEQQAQQQHGARCAGGPQALGQIRFVDGQRDHPQGAALRQLICVGVHARQPAAGQCTRTAVKFPEMQGGL